jgi:hypothetical protein
MARIAIAVIAAGALVAGQGAPRAAADANCSDFASQAAAQSYYVAHGGPAQDPDGLDADHDGIACESLPCPCSSATTPAPAPTVTPTAVPTASPTAVPTASPAPPPGVGASKPLAKVRRRSGCHVNGPLPDAACTPGARFTTVTKADVCVPGYAKRVRNVSSALKKAVYTAYAMTKHFNGRTGEVDHLVSLELGGSNDQANLFPEAARPRPGSHDKDTLENRLHALVCDGKLTLSAAQRAIGKDWVKAYAKYIGPVPALDPARRAHGRARTRKLPRAPASSFAPAARTGSLADWASEWRL